MQVDRPTVHSFATVYRDYFDFVWSTARRLGVELDAMDDLVQEVFIVVHAKLSGLKHPESLKSWVYGVVRRTASTHRRAKRAHAAYFQNQGSYGEAVSRDPTPLKQAEMNAELRVLFELLAELDDMKREVFLLVELHELSVPEAAEALGIPLNTAYSRLRTARLAYRSAVARYEARSSIGAPLRE